MQLNNRDIIPVNLNRNLVKRLYVKSKPKGVEAKANKISENPGISRIIGILSRIKLNPNNKNRVLGAVSPKKTLNEK